MRFRVEFSPRALKEMKKLPKNIREKCIIEIETLAENPIPRGVVKLAGRRNIYRIRVGKYRILYQFCPEDRLVIIVRIGKRESVYQR